MFNLKSHNGPTSLDKAIEAAFIDLEKHDADEEMYATIIKQLEALHDMKKTTSANRVSPDTLVTVGGHLLGIALIVGHERANIVTSKALGFVMKLR